MSFVKKYKKTASVLIITCALVVSLFIVRGEQEKKPDYLFEVVKNTPDALTTGINNPLPNLTAEFTAESLKTLMSERNNILAQETKNTTLAKTFPDKDAVEKIVDDIIDKEFLSEKIDPTSISRTKSESKETQIVYLMVIKEVVRSVLEKNNLENIENVSIASYFEGVAKNYNETVEMLRLMNVPNAWVEIHVKLLEFFISQKNIYTSLSLADQDPLRFMIAIQRIAEDNESRFDTIRIEIEKKIKEQKIV